ncbi:hypothetical protein, partial [Pectobacterium brasiliense]|uniref:hypothetical protein n=1 Tax=Pectobacterium brasiliense TaxID=180957 RepID=UPI001968F57A
APVFTQLTTSGIRDYLSYEVAKLRFEINDLNGSVFLSSDGGYILSSGNYVGIFFPYSALLNIYIVDLNTDIN